MMQAADEKLSKEQAQSPSAGAVSIRKARPGDIPRMQEIFAIARDFMARSGNPNQWGPDYPGEELSLIHI